MFRYLFVYVYKKPLKSFDSQRFLFFSKLKNSLIHKSSIIADIGSFHTQLKKENFNSLLYPKIPEFF
ncbi:Uncharacterised protein [Chryseobacterium gleum]|uniref:Uncharacterized protein n=1 Tax=Chryseobacterium gleum TaxID=250 RepID=A0A448BB35_CHRGE|nr:Uncharacterised protein [Chryseobacterium gleum]